MTEEEIYSKLTIILRRVFGDDSIVAVPDMTSSDVSGWDSLSHLSLIIDVQKAFGVKFSSSEAARLRDVGHLVESILNKL